MVGTERASSEHLRRAPDDEGRIGALVNPGKLDRLEGEAGQGFARQPRHLDRVGEHVPPAAR
jgi:hypothetical protein